MQDDDLEEDPGEVDEDEINEEERLAQENVDYRNNLENVLFKSSAEDIAENMINKYRKDKINQKIFKNLREGSCGPYSKTDVSQQSLLPSYQDPGIWSVKCKPGSEVETMLSLILLLSFSSF